MSATRRLSIISLDSKRNSDPVLLPVYLYQYSKKSCVYTPCQESTDIVFFPCSTSYLQVYHRLEHNMEICDNKQRQVNGSSTISYFNTTITMVHLSRKLFHMLLYVWRDITLACWQFPVPFNCVAHFTPPEAPAGQHGVKHVQFEMDGALEYLLITLIDQMFQLNCILFARYTEKAGTRKIYYIWSSFFYYI